MASFIDLVPRRFLAAQLRRPSGLVGKFLIEGIARVPVEVEGVRLIVDLVAAGAGVSVMPENAMPDDHAAVRRVRIARMPPRRLALVTARGIQLSLADQAVHDTVRTLVRGDARPGATRARERTASR